VPDLFTVHDAAKVRCFAPPEALDALATPAGALRGRIAPNEVVFVAAPGRAGELTSDLEAALQSHGNRALVVDHTDGWSFFSISGEGSADVFRRVSMVPLPAASDEPVFFMGRVCDVAAKAFRRGDRVDVMSGMEASRHVRDRLEQAGHAVGLHTVATPAADPIGVAP
jgi:hypothetical protein